MKINTVGLDNDYTPTALGSGLTAQLTRNHGPVTGHPNARLSSLEPAGSQGSIGAPKTSKMEQSASF